MTNFDPRKASRIIRETTDLRDPDSIVEAMFSQVPRKDFPGLVKAQLRAIVVDDIGWDRSSLRHEVERHQQADQENSCRGQGEGANTHDTTAPAGLARRSASAKVLGIRELCERAVDVTVLTATGWKRQGDCVPADFRYMAAQRHRMASLNLSVAATYDATADQMDAEGAATADDLKDKTVLLFGQADDLKAIEAAS